MGGGPHAEVVPGKKEKEMRGRRRAKNVSGYVEAFLTIDFTCPYCGYKDLFVADDWREKEGEVEEPCLSCDKLTTVIWKKEDIQDLDELF